MSINQTINDFFNTYRKHEKRNYSKQILQTIRKFIINITPKYSQVFLTKCTYLIVGNYSNKHPHLHTQEV